MFTEIRTGFGSAIREKPAALSSDGLALNAAVAQRSA
jgi:hypothetical protein